MRAFQLATEAQVEREGSEDEEKVEEYPLTLHLGPYELKYKLPTPAQVSLLIGTSQLGGSASLGATYRFLRGTFDKWSYNLLLTLVEDGKVTQDMIIGGESEDEGGIVDELIKEASERPTEPPTASSSSSQAGGKRSTGRSPGKGSTLSE